MLSDAAFLSLSLHTHAMSPYSSWVACLPPPSMFSIFVFKLNQECLPSMLAFCLSCLDSYMLERTVLWGGCCGGWTIIPVPLYSHGVLPAGPTCSSEWSAEWVGLCCVSDLAHHCAVPIAESAKPALHSNQEASSPQQPPPCPANGFETSPKMRTIFQGHSYP